jgi:ATPase subunit of ABC transporter with duplicated ATPase domains
VIAASGIELRAGSRLLLDGATFRIAAGDRVGLVGRNGAGKTTLTKVLAGQGQPAAGSVTSTGEVGYLPQDPRTGDLHVLARDRILSARGLDRIITQMREAEGAMASADDETRDKAMRRYSRLEGEFTTQGGYAAESEAATIASALSLEERVLGQPLATLSGGQRRRVELSRILFSGASTLLLDEPTNHLDANRGELDVYNVGWKPYLQQRETDERARKREYANATKKAAALMEQAEKMRAKATKAVAAQNMIKRAERMLAGVEGERTSDKVAKLRFPDPASCGKTPLRASGLSRSYGSQEVFTDVDLAIDRGSRVVVLGLNGAGKTTLLRMLAGADTPDTGQVEPGHGLKLGYYAQEHENLDVSRSVLANMKSAAPDSFGETEVRKVLGSFLFSGDDVDKPAKVLSGGEKTRLSLAMLVVSSANVLLLDEPTNNLDPASREEILGALRTYKGAVVLVTHDEGAVEALEPERILLLPDGVEDHWGPDYLDLISLA